MDPNKKGHLSKTSFDFSLPNNGPDPKETRLISLFLKSLFSTVMFIAAQNSWILSPSFFVTP